MPAAFVDAGTPDDFEGEGLSGVRDVSSFVNTEAQ
jgi:hypothetical protein